MDDGDRTAIEPVAREVEVRPEADFKTQNFLIKVAGRIEIVGFYRDMMQCVDRHGSASSESVRPGEYSRSRGARSGRRSALPSARQVPSGMLGSLLRTGRTCPGGG